MLSFDYDASIMYCVTSGGLAGRGEHALALSKVAMSSDSLSGLCGAGRNKALWHVTCKALYIDPAEQEVPVVQGRPNDDKSLQVGLHFSALSAK